VKQVIIARDDLLLSPNDVIIECKGERIGSHAIILRRCEYFTTLLDNADLGNYGPDNIKTISLPPAFIHDPSDLRKFLMVLYNTLNESDDDDLKHYSKENIVALAELAHYFDAPLVLAMCDGILASNYASWFPGKLVWLTQVAIKTHLPTLQDACVAELAADGSDLLAHLDNGRGILSRNPTFLCQIISALFMKREKLLKDGGSAVLSALRGIGCNGYKKWQRSRTDYAANTINDVLKKIA
jgi:hypothetical protein